MTEPVPHPVPWKGALAGLAGGLVASLAMNEFQALLSKIGAAPESTGDPSTIKAANKVTEAVEGVPVPREDRRLASNSVHYGLGAVLGMAYGVAAEFRPAVTAGGGAALGLGTSLVIDEGLVPALGLGPSPLKASAGSHLYGLVSHLVFGATAEATRRLVRRAVA